jgi:hypothetical protein
MKSQPLLLRVPVVIFAVLVGGIFVYARSGGRFFATPARLSPATAPDAHEPGGGPAIMMGSKSAPAFLPEKPSSPPETPRATLLPGSKSAAIVVGEIQSTPNTTVQIVPNSSPDPKPSARLLPGSKSVILVDPPLLTPAQSAQPAPPSNQRNRP